MAFATMKGEEGAQANHELQLIKANLTPSNAHTGID